MGGGPQAGPYGYTEKGTFFTDDSLSGFPNRIEMVYQGFVWAFTMHYPDQSPVLHGGVHTILKDKVKSESLDLKGDYIVRVTGRASPYNINRLTLYTKQGKKYGPWGDRHSEELPLETHPVTARRATLTKSQSRDIPLDFV